MNLMPILDHVTQSSLLVSNTFLKKRWFEDACFGQTESNDHVAVRTKEGSSLRNATKKT